MKKLILVRHAETNWNKQKRIQGIKDIPLASSGVKQAKKLGKRLKNTKIDLIITSSLKRTIQTAKEVAKHHPKIKQIKEKRINEMDWGVWEGEKIDQIKTTFPESFKKRNKDKFNYRIPKGESIKDVMNRTKPFITQLKKRKEQHILIVCHAGTKRVLMGHLLKWSQKKISAFRIHNTGVSIIHLGRPNKLRLKNSTHHL